MIYIDGHSHYYDTGEKKDDWYCERCKNSWEEDEGHTPAKCPRCGEE